MKVRALLLASTLLLSVSLVASRAAGDEALTLNAAEDEGLVRIDQARSAGGYSHFLIELENLTNRTIDIDPYGSAFDPPRGVRTQRIGIGRLAKVGGRTVDQPRGARTSPGQEAPVGPGSGQEGEPAIPDDALPVAAGAAAGAAAVGTLLTGLAQGVRPREVLDDLAGVLQGEAETPAPGGDPMIETIKSYRDQDMTDLDFQRQRLDAARQQGAADVARDAEENVRRLTRQIGDYDRNLAELGEQPREHAPAETRTFDYARHDLNDDARADVAAGAAGTLSDTDGIRIKLWIADNAPTVQAMDDMQKLADSMTTRIGDGTVLGDRHAILDALGDELQRTNKPRLTSWENYAVREGEPTPGPWAGAKQAKDGLDLHRAVRDITGDAGLDEYARKALELNKADGLADQLGKQVDLVDIGVSLYGDTQKYMDGGSSGTMAFTRAAVNYGVDFAVNKGMEANPVLKVVNTALKFTEPVFGKDITPARGYKVLVDRAFDSYTGDLGHKDAPAMDFNSDEVRGVVRQSQVRALEERLGSGRLTTGERADLTGRLQALKGTR